MLDGVDFVVTERQRIVAVNRQREREVNPDMYAPWQPAHILACAERKRKAAKMLHQAGVFPRKGDQCLEVGYGSLGWLGDLITWGVRETDLHGIELDPVEASRAKEKLPAANLLVGDATYLPWESKTFRLVIASTVFTSVLNPQVQHMIASEITRVLIPGGALLWYDFAFNNPKNPHVRKVSRTELRELFPQLEGEIKSVTLAPPLARLVAPRSWMMATLLEGIPLLCTHLVAVLKRVTD